MKSVRRYCDMAWRLAFVAASVRYRAAEFMFRARVDGQMLEGKPLSWNAEQMLLLGRDGQLYEFNPKLAKEAQKTSPRFFGYSSSEMKSAACSRNSASNSTCRRRGIIWSCIRRASGTSGRIGSRICTIVSSITFASADSRSRSRRTRSWRLCFATRRNTSATRRPAARRCSPARSATTIHRLESRVLVRHDDRAAVGRLVGKRRHDHPRGDAPDGVQHGHSRRFSGTPRWLVGRPGDDVRGPRRVECAIRSHAGRSRESRPAGRFSGLRRDAVEAGRRCSTCCRPTGCFKAIQPGAYAEAWALSFYLSETQPRLYAAYLAKTAERPLFGDYPAAERVADFQDIFGGK